MAEEKKFYWLKLQEDFFDSKRIKRLRKFAGGDTLTIIYLKMQLLSIKTDGIIKYDGLEKNFAEELALDLDEDADNVAMLLNYLQSTGLIETSDNVNFFLPYVVENTGSETTAAQRMREKRYQLSQKRLLGSEQNSLDDEQCSNNVQECSNNVEHRSLYKEIEIDKELDIEKELDINNKYKYLTSSNIQTNNNTPLQGNNNPDTSKMDGKEFNDHLNDFRREHGLKERPYDQVRDKVRQ